MYSAGNERYTGGNAQRLSTVYSIHVIIMQETEEASVVPTQH